MRQPNEPRNDFADVLFSGVFLFTFVATVAAAFLVSVLHIDVFH